MEVNDIGKEEVRVEGRVMIEPNYEKGGDESGGTRDLRE